MEPTSTSFVNLQQLNRDSDDNDGSDDNGDEKSISTSWITPIRLVSEQFHDTNLTIDTYYLDTSLGNWVEFLCNLIKVGRLSFGLNFDACDLYYTLVLPNFSDSFYFSSLRDTIVKALHGQFSYNKAVAHIQEPPSQRYSSEIDAKAHALYENVFSILSSMDSSMATIEFQRTFDMESLELVNMAVRASGGELQEGVTLALAKWSLPIPTRKGLLTIYGTNIIFSRTDLNFHSHLSGIQSGVILTRLEKHFRIIDKYHHKDLRLGCTFQSFDIYVTLSQIPCTCTFDTDVYSKFVNIPSEPYPYDTVHEYERVCISIYVPDETISKKLHSEISTYINNIILESFQLDSNYDFYIISNFTQLPLIPYQTTVRDSLQFDKYFFHKFLTNFSPTDKWKIMMSGPMEIPITMHRIQIECMLVIHRPVLSSIKIIPTNSKYIPSMTNLFLKYWCIDDIIEIHCKFTTTALCSRKEVVNSFREKRKAIGFKIFNGFLMKSTSTATRNTTLPGYTLDDVFDTYDTLLHLWMATVTAKRNLFIKTWTDEEQKSLTSISSLKDEFQFKDIITSVKHFFLVTNTFSGKTNLVNVAEITRPDVSFTLIFDYPVNFFDFTTMKSIEVNECNVESVNFKSIESIALAQELFAFKQDIGEERGDLLLPLPNGKYIFQCPQLPAVILIGTNWNETDALHITKFYDKISHNIIHTVQYMLCKNTIMTCIVSHRNKK